MLKTLAVAGIAVLASAAVRPAAAKGPWGPKPDVIYGDDDRLDLYQVKDPRIISLADSTVALFKSGSVKVDAQGGTAALATEPYGESMGLCKTEPFYNQKSGAFCSGSLVGPDLVMTAGHCVTSARDCKSVKFVFGFAIKAKGAEPDTVPSGDVYGCGQLLGREQVDAGADWALIKLDRPVAGHKPLALSKGDPAKDAPLFVIGHPSGLPTKVAGGATVRNPSPNGYFVANLDTYGGNSGSAVFNAQNGLVEGILVRGEQDFEDKNGCKVSKACPADGCRGEDVTKVSSVKALPPGGGSSSLSARLADPGPGFRRLLDEARAQREDLGVSPVD